MGWLSKLFGDQSSDYERMRGQYSASTQPYLQQYQAAIGAAKPIDQSYSSAFERGYTQLGREQAATQAAQRYRSALSPGFAKSAVGRQQSATLYAQTAGQLAQQEAANRLGLEQAKIGLAQQNQQARAQYAGLTGQGYGAAAGQASAEGQFTAQGLASKAAARQGMMSFAGQALGAIAGPSLSGLGGALAGQLGLGTPSFNKYLPGGKNANPYAAAAGTVGNRSNLMTGDGGSAPELILNPTGAPLTVVPLTNKTTSRWVSPQSMMPAKQLTPRSPYARLPRYAGGGMTKSVMFITGEGKTGGY